jgi:hypothetical protein
VDGSLPLLARGYLADMVRSGRARALPPQFAFINFAHTRTHREETKQTVAAHWSSWAKVCVASKWTLHACRRPAAAARASACCYWSLARTAEAPLEHNFRYPRIRELTVDNDAIALGAPHLLTPRPTVMTRYLIAL